MIIQRSLSTTYCDRTQFIDPVPDDLVCAAVIGACRLHFSPKNLKLTRPKIVAYMWDAGDYALPFTGRTFIVPC
jgi:hypothetical protein